jgi:hypothetical protein
MHNTTPWHRQTHRSLQIRPRLASGLLLLATGSGCDHYLTSRVRAELQLPVTSPTTAQHYEGKSCAELYAEVYRLFPSTYADTSDFTGDERNAGIAALGVIFEPALLGFGYTATTEYLARRHVEVAAAELDELRRVNALKGCWLR